jgi:hypothetical protein
MSKLADKAPTVDIVAAREHAITSRRTRVHVIVCHDLDRRSRDLFEIFSFAARVSPEVITAVGRELAADILRDVATLKTDLDSIEAFARRQLAKIDGA